MGVAGRDTRVVLGTENVLFLELGGGWLHKCVHFVIFHQVDTLYACYISFFNCRKNLFASLKNLNSAFNYKFNLLIQGVANKV